MYKGSIFVKLCWFVLNEEEIELRISTMVWSASKHSFWNPLAKKKKKFFICNSLSWKEGFSVLLSSFLSRFQCEKHFSFSIKSFATTLAVYPLKPECNFVQQDMQHKWIRLHAWFRVISAFISNSLSLSCSLSVSLPTSILSESAIRGGICPSECIYIISMSGVDSSLIHV